MSWRAISSAEASLVTFLCGIAENVDCPTEWSNLKVRSLDDGAMGSFQIVGSSNAVVQGSKRVASTGQAFDLDGVLIIATLFVDEANSPCEVDIWKVDFGSLQRMPTTWKDADIPTFPGGGLGRQPSHCDFFHSL
jgi:hypothetical protein